MVNENIVEDGTTRTLKKFADAAIAYLKDHPREDAVIQQTNHTTQLVNNTLTSPDRIYPLPEGYEYNFTGYYGQDIGVGRQGTRQLYR